MLGKLVTRLFSRSGADVARAAFDAGMMAFQAGDYGEAASRFERACELDPSEDEYHRHAILAHLNAGDRDSARRCLEAALAVHPDLRDLRELIQFALPGPTYLDLLRKIHNHLRPRTYLEIGVEKGRSIGLVRPETRAIGIDPKPMVSQPLSARTTIHSVTSDEYFATHDLHAELEGAPADLAFIDGMHQFEFALRDFINVEKFCSPQSTILIHDCYPFDRLTAERERHAEFWSGDIWRLMLALKKYRPDLRLYTIATAPTGLGVARGLDPRSRMLEEQFDDIVREFLALDYSVLDDDKPGKLGLYPNDWEKIKAILQ